jgi:uncharacterized repeat protein (TIGR01451 family)
MLNKILENLQFDPRYWKELKYFQQREARNRTLRGLGVVFVVAALGVQAFAFIGAPKGGAAPSPNDVMQGGVTSQQQMVDRCTNNDNYSALVYDWYGVRCSDIAAGQVVNIKSTDYYGDLYSIGHSPQGFPSEYPVSIWGTTMYWRHLHDWDHGPYSSYTAVKVTNIDHLTYWILFDCGNLVSWGKPTPHTNPVPPPPTPNNPKPPPPIVLCAYNSNLPANSPLCKPCDNAKAPNDALNCLLYNKSAANITQNVSNANGTTANPGDTIRYTLKVTNHGKLVAKNFVVQEDIGDVLIYANPGELNGGTLKGNMLSWPAQTIPAGGVVQHQFTVTVKNPLPATPAGSNDPTAYDNKMTNIYGDTVQINVKQPNAVVVSSTLPNTGPGTGVIIMSLVLMAAGYFYFRSRLLLKEAVLVEAINAEGAL